MSMNVAEKLSLLASLPPLRQKTDNTGIQEEHGFANRLEQAISGKPSFSGSTREAAVLAESLSLQMLQTSLSLAGDPPAESSVLRPLPSVNSLLQAYSANAPLTGESSTTEPASSRPSAPPTQLAEISGPGETAPRRTGGNHGHGDPSWLDPVIARASRRYGVDASLIKAVIKAESNFNPQAVSHAGARGLMQLMPATARSLGVSDSFDPEQNVMAGTRFLSDMLNRYNGDVDSALAAYNWGPGNVDRRPDRLPKETRDYLVRVKQLYSSYNG